MTKRIQIVTAAVVMFATLTIAQKVSNCWKDAYGRGVGEVISVCPAGYERSGALCYPRCRAGFSGNGPVCWQNCQAGFHDMGVSCTKPASYGRGAGYVIFLGG